LEARIALETLLERFAEMCLLTAKPPFRDNVVLRGLAELPVSATMPRVKRQTLPEAETSGLI
jgi:hypothetical protein